MLLRQAGVFHCHLGGLAWESATTAPGSCGSRVVVDQWPPPVFVVTIWFSWLGPMPHLARTLFHIPMLSEYRFYRSKRSMYVQRLSFQPQWALYLTYFIVGRFVSTLCDTIRKSDWVMLGIFYLISHCHYVSITKVTHLFAEVNFQIHHAWLWLIFLHQLSALASAMNFL